MIEKTTRRAGLMPCLLALALALGACNSNSSSRSNTPTDPEPLPPVDVVVQTFRGDLPQKGRKCHDFTLGADGSVTLEITELEPLPTLTVGMGIGQPTEDDPPVCAIIAEDRSVRTFELFLSEGLIAGPYCVCIFDVGNIFPGETVTYAIVATHP